MNLRLTLFLIAGITLRLAAQSSQDLRFRMSGFHTEPASARLFDPQSGFNLSAPSGNDAYTCALFFQGTILDRRFDGPMIRRFSVGGAWWIRSPLPACRHRYHRDHDGWR